MLFQGNLIDDHQTLILKCFLYSAFQTMIEYDMKVHLMVIHRMKGKCFDMDDRIRFVTNIIRLKKEFYDHRTAKFAQLHNLFI